jgi:hypothetical protein
LNDWWCFYGLPYKFIALKKSDCSKLAAKSPTKILKSSPWAHHFPNKNACF